MTTTTTTTTTAKSNFCLLRKTSLREKKVGPHLFDKEIRFLSPR
jgi:hypothetical protein